MAYWTGGNSIIARADDQTPDHWMIQHGIIGRCGSDKRNDSVLRVYEEGEMKKGRTVMIVIAVLALVIEGCVTGGGDVPVSLVLIF